MQVFSIGNLSRLEKVLHSKKESAGQTEIANRINGDPESRILGPPHGVGGYYQCFRALERLDDVIQIDIEFQLGSGRNSLFKVPVEFSKVGSGCHSHPNHKVLIRNVFERADNVGVSLIEVLGGVLFRVVVGITEPVRLVYRRFLARKVEGLTARSIASTLGTNLGSESIGHFEFVLKIRPPGNPILSERIQVAIGVKDFLVESKNVVEKCVGNQSTRINGDSSQNIEGIAVGRFDGALATDASRQLVVISGGHVFVVVLVKVGEFVVDQDRWLHVLGNLKCEGAVLVCVIVCANATAHRCHALLVSVIVDLLEFHDFIRFSYQIVS